MQIITSDTILRPWSMDDVDSLVRYADNPRIAAGMRNAFPFPYTRDDAERFISTVACDEKNLFFAIVFKEEAIGSIGIHRLEDVYSCTAEIGYWLAEPFWGRGVITNAVQALVPVAFKLLPIERIQAGVFSSNVPSMRVLEKTGFIREAVHVKAIYKQGQLLDEVIYVRFRK
jgi:[ribosomal protein S5]-alanine N-acetyltransferase